MAKLYNINKVVAILWYILRIHSIRFWTLVSKTAQSLDIFENGALVLRRAEEYQEDKPL